MIGFEGMCQALLKHHPEAVRIDQELLVNCGFISGTQPLSVGPYLYMRGRMGDGHQIPLSLEQMLTLRMWLDSQIIKFNP